MSSAPPETVVSKVGSRIAQIDFRIHVIRCGGDDGARLDFHRMLSALIGQVYPTATEVRADPGDWGIDVFVGSLVDKVSIWQSKYFYTSIGDAQKRQIRESFESAMKHAAKEKYEVEAWTLCVACELSGPERKWWDTKKKAWEKQHPGLSVELWDAPVLRRMLLAPEAARVVAEFYPDAAAQPPARQANTVPPVSTEEAPEYRSALFVRQLREAGISELDAQRAAYFNADLLVRDVEARAVPTELAAVREIDMSLVGHWEDAVADPTTAPTATEYEASARRLFAHVMRTTVTFAPPPELPVRPLHVRGLMHRVVEDARAGWVHDWRDVAIKHANETAGHPDPAEAAARVKKGTVGGAPSTAQADAADTPPAPTATGSQGELV